MQRVKWLMGLLLLMAVAASVAGSGQDEFRAFTSVDGRTIEARIVVYDAKKGMLQIERRGKRKIWVTPNVFSKKDQQYINEWIVASAFLSNSNLRISLQKKSTGSVGRSGESFGTDKNQVHKLHFEVKVRNNSRNSMHRLKIEYYYYVRTKAEGREDTICMGLSGSINIGTLEAAQGKTYRTDTLRLETQYRKYGNSGNYEELNWKISSEEELLGIVVRISGPEVEGKALYRDVVWPSGLRLD